jgi:hypothetical protein
MSIASGCSSNVCSIAGAFDGRASGYAGATDCQEYIKLAGLGDTSCGRSFTPRPPEERVSPSGHFLGRLSEPFPGADLRARATLRGAVGDGLAEGEVTTARREASLTAPSTGQA